jgi:hypothetical protein
MGLDQQTQEIDGHKWTVTQFPARPGNKYKVRLAKMVGPGVAELLPALGTMKEIVAKGAKGSEGLDLGIDLAMVPNVVARIAQHVDEDLFVDTLVELMAFSTRDDTQITPEHFDLVFAGNDSELYKAIWFILKVNYSDFIEWLRMAATGYLQMVRTELPQKTPPSTSAPSKE